MRIASPPRWLWSTLLAAAVALFAVPEAGATADPPSAAHRLVTEYAPITKVREEKNPPCETSAEQYEPTSVYVVLGNPTVSLERARSGRKRAERLKTAPTLRDIAGRGRRYFLNLNGSPLGDTCVYARDFKALKRRGRAPVVTYARIARERGYGGLVVQYWFYWYFNQFNDLHESDWEGMQIAFDADTPEEALAEEPSEIVLFQHAGGERAGWDDGKVEKEGRHPVVYPAAGSHATFYSSAVYVENGQHGSGLGCDNTSGPLRELRPRAALLPHRVTHEGPFAWLSYRGRWGEQRKGFNNGPAGPATKTVWHKPFSWMADQRETSARMPGGSVVGPAVVKTFCGAVETVSELLNDKERASAATTAALVLLLVLVVAFVGVTRWRPVDLERLRARRAFGQLLRTARRLYGRHWRPMVAVALAAIPIVGGTQHLVQTLGPASAAGLAFGDLLQTLSRPVAMVIVSGVVIVFVRSLVETSRASLADSWRGLARRFWRVATAELLATIGVLLMFLTVVGIPFGVWKFVGWTFVKQEVLISDKSVGEAFRGSSALVRGRWWHTLRPVLFLSVIGAIAGPILAFALIFTALPLLWINVLGSLVFALLIPYVALGETLLYFDLQSRAGAVAGRS